MPEGACCVPWRCGAVRCGAVWCGVVRCGAVRCGAVRISIFENPTVRFGAVLFKAKPDGAVRFGKTRPNRTEPKRTARKKRTVKALKTQLEMTLILLVVYSNAKNRGGLSAVYFFSETISVKKKLWRQHKKKKTLACPSVFTTKHYKLYYKLY